MALKCNTLRKLNWVNSPSPFLILVYTCAAHLWVWSGTLCEISWLLVCSSVQLQMSLAKCWSYSAQFNVFQKENLKIQPPPAGNAAPLQSVPSPWFWAFIMQLSLSRLLFKAELKVELNSWRSRPCCVMQDYWEGRDRKRQAAGAGQFVLLYLPRTVQLSLKKKTWIKPRNTSLLKWEVLFCFTCFYLFFFNAQKWCGSVCCGCCHNQTNHCC